MVFTWFWIAFSKSKDRLWKNYENHQNYKDPWIYEPENLQDFFSGYMVDYGDSLDDLTARNFADDWRRISEIEQLSKMSDDELASIAMSTDHRNNNNQKTSSQDNYSIFDIKVNGLRFVGCQSMLSLKNNIQVNKSAIRERKRSRRESQNFEMSPNEPDHVGQFNVCFILKGMAGSDIGKNYQRIARQFSRYVHNL